MKRKQLIWFRAKPLLLWFTVTFLLTALFRLFPTEYYVPLCAAGLFFLYGVLSFRRHTDLFLQFGISRTRQIGSIFALVPICVLSGVLCTLLPILYQHIFKNTGIFYSGVFLYDCFITFPERQAVWWAAAHFSLKNILALFAGSFLGALVYIRPKDNRLTAGIACGAGVVLYCAFYGIARLLQSPYFHNVNAQAFPRNDFEMVLQAFTNNILFGYTDGDALVLQMTSLLFWCILFAAGTCLLLRRLPQR